MLVWISVFIYQAGVIEIILKSAQHDPFLGPHVQVPEEQQQFQNNDTKDDTPDMDTKDQNIDYEKKGEEVDEAEKERNKHKNDKMLFSKFRNLTFLQGSSKNLSAMIHSKTSQNTG